MATIKTASRSDALGSGLEKEIITNEGKHYSVRTKSSYDALGNGLEKEIVDDNGKSYTIRTASSSDVFGGGLEKEIVDSEGNRHKLRTANTIDPLTGKHEQEIVTSDGKVYGIRSKSSYDALGNGLEKEIYEKYNYNSGSCYSSVSEAFIADPLLCPIYYLFKFVFYYLPKGIIHLFLTSIRSCKAKNNGVLFLQGVLSIFAGFFYITLLIKNCIVYTESPDWFIATILQLAVGLVVGKCVRDYIIIPLNKY